MDFKNDIIKKLESSSHKFHDPWDHSICDNFLPNSVFESLSNESFDSEKATIHRTKHGGEVRKIEHDCLDELSQSYINCFESDEVKMSFLNHFGVSGMDDNSNDDWSSRRSTFIMDTLSDLKIKVDFRSHGPGFNYPAHTDVSSKIMALMIYISPKNINDYVTHNLGTVLYGGKKHALVNCGSVNWKENRSLLFQQKNNVTWHSYQVEENSYNNRVVLMINYQLTKLKNK